MKNLSISIFLLVLAITLIPIGLIQTKNDRKYFDEEVKIINEVNLNQDKIIRQSENEIYKIKKLFNIKECDLGFSIGDNRVIYYWREDIPLEENDNYDYMLNYCYQTVQADRCEFCRLLKKKDIK